jgi:MFS family permease
MLALLGAAEFLGMSLWFTAGATAPELSAALGLTGAQSAALVAVVQWGFVGGTLVAAVLSLADVLPSRIYLPAAALLAALANLGILAATSFELALTLRFLTGFFLAGVYPPAMKMIATWFRAGRGMAIGTVVGALTLGKSTPYLMKALEGIDVAVVMSLSSAGAGAAALLVLAFYRDGPFAFRRAPFRWDQIARVLNHRPTRLAIGGYLGHMWELYSVWAGMVTFLTLRLGDAGLGSFGAFLAIAAGAPGCVLAGLWADRFGRERIAALAMILSGGTALVAGWLPAFAPLLLGVVVFWGFWVVADSAQFSALVTEVSDSETVGTALTLQTGLGFALTGVAIPFTLWMADRVGWGWAFSTLAVGPAAGVWAMGKLAALRAGRGRAAEVG